MQAVKESCARISTRMMKTITAISFLLIFVMPGFAGLSRGAPAGENIITKIEITGNRIHESVIRANLAFREGDTVDDEKIEKSRANLYALGVFKSLEIFKERDESSGGIKIVIEAQDSWYVFPLPMFGRRGGEKYFAAAIFEQNIFKNGERIASFASFQDSISRYMLSTDVNKFTFSGALDRSIFTEHQYSDGAYNSQFIMDKDIGALENYGKIVNSYGMDETVLRFNAGLPLAEKTRGTARRNFQRYSV